MQQYLDMLRDIRTHGVIKKTAQGQAHKAFSATNADIISRMDFLC